MTDTAKAIIGTGIIIVGCCIPLLVMVA